MRTPVLTRRPLRCTSCGHSLKDRSSRQNKYLWLVYQMIADEIGTTPEDIHSQLKEKFLPRIFITVGDEERESPKTTTLLSTTQMEDYLMKVRQWAGEFLNLSIPLPGESL